MNLNKVQLIGRVTKDPELKTLPSGTAVVSFGIATNYSYKDKEGNKVENVSFHNCKLFGKGAEVFATYVIKGQEVYVSGRLEYREWDKKDGGKDHATDILVEEFQFGQKPQGAQNQNAPAPAQQRQGVISDSLEPQDGSGQVAQRADQKTPFDNDPESLM